MRSRLVIMYLRADETASEHAGGRRDAQVRLGSEGRGHHITLFQYEEHLGALDSLAMSWGHRKVLINRTVSPKGRLPRCPGSSLHFPKAGGAVPLTLAVSRPPSAVSGLSGAPVLPSRDSHD